jgi:hypothetical protein
MTIAQILKEKDFKEVSVVRPDVKRRVTLGKVEVIQQASTYKVYQNSAGQIILDPQVSIPASEAWVYKNKAVIGAIKRGVEDAQKGKVRKAREGYSKYIKDEE